MAGMMPSAAQSPSPAQDGAGAEMPQARKPTQQEQQLFEDFIGNAINALYQPETANRVANLLRTGQKGINPVEQIGMVTAMIVNQVQASAEQSGQDIPAPIVVRAAAKVASDIGTELAPAAGLPPLSENHVKGAYLRAMEILGEDRREKQVAPVDADRAVEAITGPMSGAAANPTPP